MLLNNYLSQKELTKKGLQKQQWNISYEFLQFHGTSLIEYIGVVFTIELKVNMRWQHYILEKMPFC